MRGYPARACAFNSEPGRASGNIVIERRGGVFIRLAIRGKAAHAGIDPGGGISAIEELAHKILALHRLGDLNAGISVNVGVVSGGQSVNTTAPFADAFIDLRFREPGDRERVMAAIGAIVGKPCVTGALAVLEITGEFAPLVATSESTALLRFYQRRPRTLGYAGIFNFAHVAFSASVRMSPRFQIVCGYFDNIRNRQSKGLRRPPRDS